MVIFHSYPIENGDLNTWDSWYMLVAAPKLTGHQQVRTGLEVTDGVITANKSLHEKRVIGEIYDKYHIVSADLDDLHVLYSLIA